MKNLEQRTPHEVGGVYIPFDRRRREFNFAGDDFDQNFMSGLISTATAVLGIFGLTFVLVMIL